MERYAYDAYGKVTVTDGSGTVLSGSAYGNRYTYTGREWDGELGLYHYRARMYSPDTGRFVSRDPIGYVDGETLYQYVEGSPINFVDPEGQATERPGLEGEGGIWLDPQIETLIKDVKTRFKLPALPFGYCMSWTLNLSLSISTVRVLNDPNRACPIVLFAINTAISTLSKVQLGYSSTKCEDGKECVFTTDSIDRNRDFPVANMVLGGHAAMRGCKAEVQLILSSSERFKFGSCCPKPKDGGEAGQGPGFPVPFPMPK